MIKEIGEKDLATKKECNGQVKPGLDPPQSTALIQSLAAKVASI